MKFRLEVYKEKCVVCDLIVLIEKAATPTRNFICPVCDRITEKMDEITIVEEIKGVSNNS